MALNDVSFVKGQGGLGRPLPGQDFISGLLFYSASLPSGFSSTARIKKFFSPADASAAGIKIDYLDETLATGTVTVTAVGANGDTLNVTITEPAPGGLTKVVNLGTYTKAASETTVTAVATALKNLINAGTITHGYSATSAVGVVTIAARPGLGISVNSGTPLAATVSGSLTATFAQFAGGAGSKNAVMRYHINEFFRLQPQGVLYVGIFGVPGSYTFSEIQTLQNFANGTIRQIGVYKDGAAFATADLTAIQAVLNTLDAAHKPVSSVLYGADLSGTSDLSTLTDLSLLNDPKVSSIIAQDGAAVGAMLYLSYGKSITTLGAALGAVALAKVSEDIAWVGKFNISNGTECDTPAFANGKLLSDASITDSLLTTLNTYRYIFLRKFPIAGSYFNDSHTAVVQSSDYAFIENNRTIDKAIRGVYTDLLPLLNSPIQLNADGTLSDVSLAVFESAAGTQLAQMERDTEISDSEITIDPTQNIISTGKIIVAIKLVPIGTARSIQVNIGFTLSI